jgi:hypothetical protein
MISEIFLSEAHWLDAFLEGIIFIFYIDKLCYYSIVKRRISNLRLAVTGDWNLCTCNWSTVDDFFYILALVLLIIGLHKFKPEVNNGFD